ncbi:hypothetical protein ACS0TY_019423 [Phlomoides rotata]
MHSMREPVSDGNVPPQSLLEMLKDYGQEDVFALWDELSTEERDLLIKDIESIDLPRIDRIIRCSFRSQGLPAAAIEPIPESNVSTVEKRTMEERERWWKMGLKAISDGKLGVLLLSGGQVARSPDGNGGVYSALKSSKLLEDMAMRGIKYLDCYGVDNALVRVGDPTFLGYFIDKGAAAAAKVVRKICSFSDLWFQVSVFMPLFKVCCSMYWFAGIPTGEGWCICSTRERWTNLCGRV